MNEHDWETPRRHRPERPALRTNPRKDLEAIERYAALEYPRESVTWLLNPQPSADLAAEARLAPGRGNRIRGGILPPRGL